MSTINPLDSLQGSAMSEYQRLLQSGSGIYPPTPPGPEPQPAPGPHPTPGPHPAPPPPPSPRPEPENFANFVQSLTPEERAGAVPSAMQLENLEMAKNYQKDYEEASGEYVTGDSTDSTSETNSTTDSTGGLSSPQFYENMNKDAKAMNADQWVQEHLYQLENFDTMTNQFNFNNNLVINAGAANGAPVPSNFMSDPNYRAASGGVNPIAGAQSGEQASQNLADYFSPQNVANRSVDVMVSLYNGANQPGGDTAATRQSYADSMRQASERAYEQSRGQVTGMNSDVRNNLTQTNSLVSQGLDDFVQKGPDPAKNQPGGLYDQLRVYANSGRDSYEPTQPNGQTMSPENIVSMGGAPSMINTEA